VTLTPPSGAMQLVSNIKIASMGVKFNKDDPSGYYLRSSAPKISANFKAPFDFPLAIKSAAQDLNFTDVKTGKPFLNVKVPFVPAESDQKAGTLVTAFSDAPLSVIPGAEDEFAAFFKALTVGSSHTVGVHGILTSTAETAAGLVTISNVSLTDQITLSGFEGLSQVEIGKITVTSGDSSAMHMDIETTITNPSTLSLDLQGDVKMDLMYEGFRVGQVVMPQLTVVPGKNKIIAKNLFNPIGDSAIKAGQRLLSSYILGQSSPVVITFSSFTFLLSF
jgi:hypothetical protein